MAKATLSPGLIRRGTWLCLVLSILAIGEAQAKPGILHGTNDLTNFTDGVYALDVTDMGVKVQGGFVHVTRSWAEGRWQFNRRWADLDIIVRPETGALGADQTHWVERNGAMFHNGASSWLGTDSDVLVRSIGPEDGDVDLNMRITYTGSGYVWSSRAGDTVRYDEDGRITSYADRDDNQVTLERDANGNIHQVRDTNGLVVMTYAYESFQIPQTEGDPITAYRVIQVQDYTGRMIAYTYDVNDRLETVTDVRGQVWRYEYSAAGHLARIIDPNGRATTIVVDEDSGRLQSYANADGVGYQFEFGTTDGKVYQRRTDGEGRVVETYFDGMGYATREVRGGETQFTATHVYSDGSDRGTRAGLIRVSPGGAQSGSSAGGSDGVRTSSRFVADREPRTLEARIVVDQRGRTTRTEFDRFGNAIRVVRPDQSVRTTRYGAFNLPTVVTGWDGIVTEYEYDSNGNLLRLTEAKDTPAERVTEYEYDTHGNRTVIRYLGDANTQQAEYAFTYDDFGDLLTRTDPLGGVQRFTDATHPEYDPNGNAPVWQNERGNTWVFDYDAAGNLLSVADPLSRVESYTYNESGDLISYRAANNSETTYTPNASGLAVEVTNALGQTTELDFNQANQLIERRNPLDHAVQTGYDNQSRLASIRDGEGNVINFGYEAGLLRSITYPTYAQALAYDGLDRATSTTDTAPGIEQTRTSGYDLFGNVTGRTDALGRETGFGYDSARQLDTITDAAGGNTTFAYDDRGNLLTVTDPESSTTTFAYDANDHLTSETRPMGEVRSYTYYPNGLLETVANPEGEITEYVYDAADQLTETRFYADAAAYVSASTEVDG